MYRKNFNIKPFSIQIFRKKNSKPYINLLLCIAYFFRQIWKLSNLFFLFSLLSCNRHWNVSSNFFSNISEKRHLLDLLFNTVAVILFQNCSLFFLRLFKNFSFYLQTKFKIKLKFEFLQSPYFKLLYSNR